MTEQNVNIICSHNVEMIHLTITELKKGRKWEVDEGDKQHMVTLGDSGVMIFLSRRAQDNKYEW